MVREKKKIGAKLNMKLTKENAEKAIKIFQKIQDEELSMYPDKDEKFLMEFLKVVKRKLPKEEKKIHED